VLEVGNTQSWVQEWQKTSREEEERKFHTELRPTEVYDALEFWGKISGRMLREWGMSDEEVPDPDREYDANILGRGQRTSSRRCSTTTRLGEKPYAKTSFIKAARCLLGARASPRLSRTCRTSAMQRLARWYNNMAIASGPQVEVNLERIPPNEDITQLQPWKIWQVLNDPLGSSAPAVRFNQPTDNANTLVGVYDRFSRLADDHSGIPSYIYGDTNVQGAGRTASGLSMLMGSAGKGIRQVVMHIDSDVLKPIVHRQFVYNMRYDPDESIKGDAQVVAKGAVNLAVKETVNVRRVEFLNATANEFDINIIGPQGRAALLREVAKGLQMPVEDIVPSRDKLSMMERQSAAAPPPGMPAPGGGQPAMQNTDMAGAPAGGTNLINGGPQ